MAADIHRGVSYPYWSAQKAAYGWAAHHLANGLAYTGNRDAILVTSLVGDDLDNYATNHPSSTLQECEADAIAALSHLVELPRDLGRPQLVARKGTHSETKFYTHDWANPESWYMGSVRAVDLVPSWNSGEGRYEIPMGGNLAIVNTQGGWLLNEDLLLDGDGESYRVDVRETGDPDVQKAEQDKHDASGGDYTVDYANGYITPVVANWNPDGAAIKVTCHRALSSCFCVRPATGKALSLTGAEVFHADGLVVTDAISFQAYGLVEVFAPWLTPSPYPAGTKIPLPTPLVYKTYDNFLQDCDRWTTGVPDVGGGWRGITGNRTALEYDYREVRRLLSSAGMEIRLELVHGVPLTCDRAYATIKGLSEDE